MTETQTTREARSQTADSRSRWWPALAVTPLLRWLVVRHSVPAEASVLTICPQCGAQLSPGHPAAWPLARCRCGQRLGARPLTVEAMVVVLAAVLVAGPFTGWERAAFGWWIACWIVLSCVDLAVHRLPTTLTYAAAGGLLVLLAAAAVAAGDPGRLARAAAGGVGVWLLLAAGAMFGSSGLGGGDVRAGLSVGIAAGWVSWFAIVSAVFLSGVVMAGYGLWLVARRRGTLRSAAAFGPSMFIGTLLAVLLLQGMLRHV